MSISLLSCTLVVFSSFIYWLSLKWEGKSPAALMLIVLMASFSFFIYVVGFRSILAGFDTINYVIAFEALDSILHARGVGEDVFGNTEPLFWLFMAVIKKITNDVRVFLLVVSVISYILSFWAVYLITRKLNVEKYYLQTVIFSLVIMFSVYQIVYFGNQIRASLAIPLAVISICFYEVKNRNYWIYFVLAVGIHYSAFIIVLFPIFDLLLKNKSRIRILAIGSLLCFLFLSGFSDLALQVGDEYVKKKAYLYMDGGLETSIKSIFLMSSTWVIVLIAIASLLKTGISNGKIPLFFIIIIFITSSHSIMAVRFFPFLLLTSIPGFIYLMIQLFGVNKGVVVLSLNIILVTYIMFESEAVIRTLGLDLV